MDLDCSPKMKSSLICKTLEHYLQQIMCCMSNDFLNDLKGLFSEKKRKFTVNFLTLITK